MPPLEAGCVAVGSVGLVSSIAGTWTSLADTPATPFAGAANIAFPASTPWISDIVHGELIRAGSTRA